MILELLGQRRSLCWRTLLQTEDLVGYTQTTSRHCLEVCEEDANVYGLNFLGWKMELNSRGEQLTTERNLMEARSARLKQEASGLWHQLVHNACKHEHFEKRQTVMLGSPDMARLQFSMLNVRCSDQGMTERLQIFCLMMAFCDTESIPTLGQLWTALYAKEANSSLRHFLLLVAIVFKGDWAITAKQNTSSHQQHRP